MDTQNQSSQSRRKFLKKSMVIGAMAPMIIPSLSSAQADSQDQNPANKPLHPLKILILGGTSFLGPHQIAYAMSRGHSITTFTRGKTLPTIHKNLFRDVEQLIGDRQDNLEALRGLKWDAVIDNSGHREEWTRDSAALLKDNVETYLYTSSTGVYYPYLGSNIKEDTQPVLQVPSGITDYQKGEYGYGVMKALSEIEARNIYGDSRTIIVRPTYMMGPADQTDRFTYWPVRLSRGGEVMVPGKPEDPVQFIDVRDVAEYMIRLIESKSTGTSNAVGPTSKMDMMAFVHGAHAAFSTPVTFVSVPDYDFLEKKYGILDLIPWIAPVGDNYGSARINNELCVSNGIAYRPLAQSVFDIFEWWNSEAVSEDRRLKMISGENAVMAREKEILSDWKKRN